MPVAFLDSLLTDRLNRMILTQTVEVSVVTAAVETATFDVKLSFPNAIRMNCSHLMGVFSRNISVRSNCWLEMVPAWLKRSMFGLSGVFCEFCLLSNQNDLNRLAQSAESPNPLPQCSVKVRLP